MIGWLLEESFIRHPSVVTAEEIKRRLGVNEKTALLMKRRIQLMASEPRENFRHLIREELSKAFPTEFKLPPQGEQMPETIDSIVHADTIALYSASQRANKGRKRHKNRGLTSSIFLSDKLGGKQVGTLVHVMGSRQGWVNLDSVPDIKSGTIGPIIRHWLPRNTGLFTDEGYQWLFRIYPNHRMVNHSKKSKDKRYRMARDRWCQQGVSNQISEGLNGSLKTAFRSYRYIRPEYSQLYLNEWAFFKNLKHFGLKGLAEAEKRTERLWWHGVDAVSRDGGTCGDSGETITPDFFPTLTTPRTLTPLYHHPPLPSSPST